MDQIGGEDYVMKGVKGKDKKLVFDAEMKREPVEGHKEQADVVLEGSRFGSRGPEKRRLW